MASDIVFGRVPSSRVPFGLVALALLAAPAAVLAVFALLSRGTDRGIDLAHNANIQRPRTRSRTFKS